MTTADYPRALETDVVLRDGSTCTSGRSAPEDRDRMLAFLEGSRPTRAWFRFFSAAGLDGRRMGTDVDYAEPLRPRGDGRRRIGRIVAHAALRAARAARAEVAFAVADELHGHGVATILLAHLAAGRAESATSRTFIANVLPGTGGCSRCFRESGFPMLLRSSRASSSSSCRPR